MNYRNARPPAPTYALYVLQRWTIAAFAIFILTLSLTACTSADAPTAATPSTVAATAIPAEVGTTTVAEVTRDPATEHTWTARPVLINLNPTPGDTDYEYAWGLTPSLIVYADGTIMGTEWRSTAAGYSRFVWQAQLTPNELCTLLFQVEDYGFFDYQNSDYAAPDVTDSGTSHIIVNAWRQNRVDAYALNTAINDGEDDPNSPAPALVETYLLLSGLKPEVVSPYRPERIALMIYPANWNVPAPIWPLESLPLSEMTAGLGDYDKVELTFSGSEATEIYSLFEAEFSRLFSEDGQLYVVTSRPILPQEIWHGMSGWGHIAQFETTPTVEMTCERQMGAPAGSEPEPPPTPSPAEVYGPPAPLERVTEFGRRDQPGQFASATGLAMTTAGDILVSDSGNKRWQRFSLEGDLLEIVDIPKGYPSDIAVMSDGNIVIADWWENEIEIHAPDGELLETIAGWPEPEGGYEYPTDKLKAVALGPDGIIYAVENRAGRILIFDAAHELIEIWYGPAAGSFDTILDIDADPAGNLYILDGGRDEVIKRTVSGAVVVFAAEEARYVAALPDGGFVLAGQQSIARFDAAGTRLFTRQYPEAGFGEIAAGPGGLTLVVTGRLIRDSDSVVHILDLNGVPLRSFGISDLQRGQFRRHTAFAASLAGDVWVVDSGEYPLLKLVHLDPGRQFLAAYSEIDGQPLTCNNYVLAAHSDQTLFLADPCAGQISRIAADGTLLAQWGETGRGADQYSLISDMNLTPDESALLVVDSGNNRIDMVNLDGQLRERWSAADLGIGQLGAADIASDGTFFIVDALSGEIVMHTPTGEQLRLTLPVDDEFPIDIAIDETHHRFYVGADDIYLYAYTWDGTYLGWVGIGDSRDVYVQVGPDGYLYRSAGYEKIYVFRPTDVE